MRRMITGIVAAGLCVAALAACTTTTHHSAPAVGRSSGGSDSSVPATAGSSRPVGAATTSAGVTATTDSAALVSYVQGGRPVAAAAYEAGAAGSGQPMRPTPGTTEFTTPSGNIACGILGAGGAVTCSVAQYTYATPPKPANCHLNYAPGWVSLDQSGVSRGLCLGGPPFPPVSHTLTYGSTLTQGGVACRSEAAFLACADAGSGHGFVVSRDELRTY